MMATDQPRKTGRLLPDALALGLRHTDLYLLSAHLATTRNCRVFLDGVDVSARTYEAAVPRAEGVEARGWVARYTENPADELCPCPGCGQVGTQTTYGQVRWESIDSPTAT